MKQRRDITGLTGLGILLLLAAGLGFSPIVDGFLGIDVVFVCAGYLVTKEILKEYRSNAKHNRGYGWVSLTPFYRQRLLYFIPSALITLSIVVAAVSITNDTQYFTGLTADAIWAALMLANVNFIHEGVNFLSNTSSSSPLLNFWAISTYVQVLLIYPLLLVAALGFKNYRVRNQRVRYRKRALYSLALIAGISVVITMVEIVFEPDTAMFTASARLADFAIGGLFAAVRINELAFGRTQILLTRMSALTVIILSPLLFSNFAQNWASLFIAISAGFICASHSSRLPDVFSRLLGAQPLYGIGVIALQVFLWYWPILVLAHRYGFHIGYEGSIGHRMILAVLILFVATLAHFAIRFLVSLLTPTEEPSTPSDVDEDEDAQVDELATGAEETTKPQTAYQKRNQVLIAAVVGSLTIATMSAPSIIAPQVKVVGDGANPKPSSTKPTLPEYLSPRVLFLGASITAGCCTKTVPGWPQQVGTQLNWQVINLAKSGTGFTHGNTYGACSDGSCRSIAQMAVRAVTQRPDAVVVSGGRNDCRVAMSDPQRTQTAIDQTFETLRVGLPYTPIIGTSVIYNQKRTIPECYSRVNSWISAAAAKHNAYFVPNVTNWMSGHPEYINPDRVHPNDAGHTEIARRFIAWFNQKNIRIDAGVS
jgi:peptidoglycan/LPS O-acetylase OafA/YrhL/lysophospholipase L1-like esterase